MMGILSVMAWVSSVTPPAGKRPPPPLNPFSHAEAAAYTHSAHPAAFAIRLPGLSEPYSAYSLKGGFSEVTAGSRCEVSLHNPPVARDMMISDRHTSQEKFRPLFQNPMMLLIFSTQNVR